LRSRLGAASVAVPRVPAPGGQGTRRACARWSGCALGQGVMMSSSDSESAHEFRLDDTEFLCGWYMMFVIFAGHQRSFMDGFGVCAAWCW
jgi:hypothetical protein